MQVIVNHYDNEKFGEVRDRTPITGLSAKSKSDQLNRKELFSDATNKMNRPTDAVLRECAAKKDKNRPRD